ncbi:hypothetical protein PIB30_048850 [Stylosanthes scabra]|uniref:Reverse transcriptase zinc-binding domain-containing protein n=1 Tax=Stylosanthes scabra TaxID=79078 RepID=A0ABU6VF67_9FABA|nr:hypothetical protein [Stylosanthes scabra]
MAETVKPSPKSLPSLKNRKSSKQKREKQKVGDSHMARLNSRLPSISPNCQRCLNAAESVFHCFWGCPNSIEVWRLANFPLPQVPEDPWRWWLKLGDLLCMEPTHLRQSELAANIIWQLWCARNSLIFEQHRLSSAAILDAATRAMEFRSPFLG